MTTQEFLSNMDKGFFREARIQRRTPGAFLADHINPEPPEIDPVYQRLLRSLKAEDDGSYRSQCIREFARQVASLEKCFEERKISRWDTVEKFYSSANDTALFPVFLESQLIAGQLATSLVPRLAAMDQRITSHVYEKASMDEDETDRQLRHMGEGALLPKTVISTAEGQVRLYKFGRLLEYSYEAARLQALDAIGTFIQRMGVQIGIDETNELIEVLIAGDGTTSSAVTDTDAESTGVLDWDELVRLYQSFPIGYRGNQAVINDTNMRTILNMAEIKDPLAGFNVASRGVNDPVIFGMVFNRWTSTASTSFSTDRILAVDTRFSCKVLREGDFLEEADQIIDKQLWQRTFAEWVGYAKLQLSATQCLDITT